MKILDYMDILINLSLFDGFNYDNLYGLLKDNSLIKDYSQDQIIYLQNEKANTMDIVLAGSIIIKNIDENGNILSIVTLNKGDMLGGNLIFSSKNEYPMTVISKTDSKLLRLKKSMILDLCKKNEKFLNNILEVFSDKALVLTSKIHSLAKKTIREKIMEFLLFEVDRQGNNTIKLPLSKKELAERFGVERPSLQRELMKMKDEGLILYDAKNITLIK